MTFEEALARMTVPLQENGNQQVREVFNPILLLENQIKNVLSAKVS